MALTEDSLNARLSPVLEAVATEIARRGIATGDNTGAKARMDVRRENNVKRVVQVYWTPFQADIPGDLIGLHLDIAAPTKHWVEGYITPSGVSWIFCFGERPVDGEYQLNYYRQSSDYREAVRDFFDLTEWYALTPTDLTWNDVKCTITPEVAWEHSHEVLAVTGGEIEKAVQESLKKSTIIWLRWTDANKVERTMPVWFIYLDNKVYVVSGERQQTVPNARSLKEATVIVRWKGHGNSRVADLPARVRTLPPGPEWDQIAEKLAEKRLNAPGAPEDLATRWRDECEILEITFR